MGIAMIVSDEASHAFHFLQKSSQADDAKNLFHIYPGSEGIVIHQQPNSWERKIEKLFLFRECSTIKQSKLQIMEEKLKNMGNFMSK